MSSRKDKKIFLGLSDVDNRNLSKLLRTYEKLTGKIDELDEKRITVGSQAHEISERNNLAEKFGDVEVHFPFKKTLLVLNFGGRPFQIDTHIIARCIDEGGLEDTLKNVKLSKSIIHQTSVTMTKLSEMAKNRNPRAREVFIQDSGKTIELVTKRRITVMGKKREVKAEE